MTPRALWEPTPRIRIALVAAGLTCLPLMALLHYVTGPTVEFHILFLLPILLVAWFGGRTAGIAASLLALVVWTLADLALAGGLTLSAGLLFNELSRLLVFVLSVLLVTWLRDTLRREARLARLDPLTGLANRRSFLDHLDIEVTRATRSGDPLTLFFIDLDRFKEINDSAGHAVGDRLLRVVADTLPRHVRPTDVVGRLGGDEFAVICPSLADEDARLGAGRLHAALLLAMGRHDWPVTFSIGVASFYGPLRPAAELLARADALMYDVKRTGRNAVRHARY